MHKFIICALAALAVCFLLSRLANLSQIAFAMGGLAISWFWIAFLVAFGCSYKLVGGK